MDGSKQFEYRLAVQDFRVRDAVGFAELEIRPDQITGFAGNEGRFGGPYDVENRDQELHRARVLVFLFDVDFQEFQHAAFEFDHRLFGVFVLGFFRLEGFLFFPFAENG